MKAGRIVYNIVFSSRILRALHWYIYWRRKDVSLISSVLILGDGVN